MHHLVFIVYDPPSMNVIVVGEYQVAQVPVDRPDVAVVARLKMDQVDEVENASVSLGQFLQTVRQHLTRDSAEVFLPEAVVLHVLLVEATVAAVVAVDDGSR